MTNVIPFPNCRPLTKLEQRAILKARFFDDSNWSMKDGRPHIVLKAESGKKASRWINVYQQSGGGFVWEFGDAEAWDSGERINDEALWSSRKSYATWDEARHAAWTKALGSLEDENDEANWAVIDLNLYTWDDEDGGDVA
jgi:hypothetical protein